MNKNTLLQKLFDFIRDTQTKVGSHLVFFKVFSYRMPFEVALHGENPRKFREHLTR